MFIFIFLKKVIHLGLNLKIKSTKIIISTLFIFLKPKFYYNIPNIFYL